MIDLIIALVFTLDVCVVFLLLVVGLYFMIELSGSTS
jgi:hypothetical protein